MTSPNPSESPTGPKCPHPRTCDLHEYYSGVFYGWRQDPDGISRIPYWINPKVPIGALVTETEIEEAIKRSTRIWEAALPNVKFVFMGLTDRIAYVGDGFNDFTSGNSVTTKVDTDGRVIEADIFPVYESSNTHWVPCEQRDDSCTDTGHAGIDLMDVAVHELGHVLGLGDLGSEEAKDLTMGKYTSTYGNRAHVTLGLGDILGARKFYPCGCPLPRIYVP